MDDGIPQPPRARSLMGELGRSALEASGAMRAWVAARPGARAGRRAWWVAGALAALIAAGPVLTIVAGKLATGSARGEAARLREQAAPRAAAVQALARDRAALVAMLKQPGLGAVMEALARALPAEAVLIRAERGAQGLLEVDIASPDPDRLRAAIRAEPALARLRNVGQQQGDLLMTVSFKEPPK
jgi:hypothetical protein